MKTKSYILALGIALTTTFVACDSDGNTGNGANDPTARFESDKVKKVNENYVAPDTTTPAAPLNIVDTTMVEGRHK